MKEILFESNFFIENIGLYIWQYYSALGLEAYQNFHQISKFRLDWDCSRLQKFFNSCINLKKWAFVSNSRIKSNWTLRCSLGIFLEEFWSNLEVILDTCMSFMKNRGKQHFLDSLAWMVPYSNRFQGFNIRTRPNTM